MEWFNDLIGTGREPVELTAGQVAIRAAIVYGFTLACVRLGHKRLLNRGTAFDVVLAIMLGAIASRAINGNARMLPTLAGVAALVALHWLVAAITFRSSAAGVVFKGKPRVLVRGGALERDAMRKSHVTEHDIEEALRRRGHRTVEEVDEVVLERDGELSVISREPPSPGGRTAAAAGPGPTHDRGR
jgi:uncharacterized membrane protein YcaP (DUF421 family)